MSVLEWWTSDGTVAPAPSRLRAVPEPPPSIDEGKVGMTADVAGRLTAPEPTEVASSDSITVLGTTPHTDLADTA